MDTRVTSEFPSRVKRKTTRGEFKEVGGEGWRAIVSSLACYAHTIRGNLRQGDRSFLEYMELLSNIRVRAKKGIKLFFNFSNYFIPLSRIVLKL